MKSVHIINERNVPELTAESTKELKKSLPANILQGINEGRIYKRVEKIHWHFCFRLETHGAESTKELKSIKRRGYLRIIAEEQNLQKS